MLYNWMLVVVTMTSLSRMIESNATGDLRNDTMTSRLMESKATSSLWNDTMTSRSKAFTVTSVGNDATTSRLVESKATSSPRDDTRFDSGSTGGITRGNSNTTLSAHEPPTLLSKLYRPTILIHKGNTVRLTCPVYAKPRPFIFWSRDGYQISTRDSGKRVRVVRGKLRIGACAEHDSGLYTCKAVNGFGNILVHIELVVSTNQAPGPKDTVDLIVKSVVTQSADSHNVKSLDEERFLPANSTGLQNAEQVMSNNSYTTTPPTVVHYNKERGNNDVLNSSGKGGPVRTSLGDSSDDSADESAGDPAGDPAGLSVEIILVITLLSIATVVLPVVLVLTIIQRRRAAVVTGVQTGSKREAHEEKWSISSRDSTSSGYEASIVHYKPVALSQQSPMAMVPSGYQLSCQKYARYGRDVRKEASTAALLDFDRDELFSRRLTLRAHEVLGAAQYLQQHVQHPQYISHRLCQGPSDPLNPELSRALLSNEYHRSTKNPLEACQEQRVDMLDSKLYSIYVTSQMIKQGLVQKPSASRSSPVTPSVNHAYYNLQFEYEECLE